MLTSPGALYTTPKGISMSAFLQPPVRFRRMNLNLSSATPFGRIIATPFGRTHTCTMCRLASAQDRSIDSLTLAPREADLNPSCRDLGVFLASDEVDLGGADVGVAGELP